MPYDSLGQDMGHKEENSLCALLEMSRALHLRQGRCVVTRDEVGPKEKLGREEALMLHAAGLRGAAPRIPEAVALGMLLRR